MSQPSATIHKDCMRMVPGSPAHYEDVQRMNRNISLALVTNGVHRGHPEMTSRAKVLETQLHRASRLKHCRLLGVQQSIDHIFSEIQPVLLPNILALIGARHEQNELYRALISTSPDFVSLINRDDMIQKTIAKSTQRIATISDEIVSLSAEMAV